MEGSNDVLILALGTPEHSRHVKGVEMRVTHTSFFHTLTPYREPKQAGQQKVIDDLQKYGMKGSKPKRRNSKQ